MSHSICFSFLGLGAAMVLALAGCSKKTTATAPLPMEQVPQAVESAFKSAPQEASVAATEAVTAVREDDPNALANLQDLSSRSDLNDEQRAVAARAMAAYLKQLHEKAEKGDKKADEAIQQYRATK